MEEEEEKEEEDRAPSYNFFSADNSFSPSAQLAALRSDNSHWFTRKQQADGYSSHLGCFQNHSLQVPSTGRKLVRKLCVEVTARPSSLHT